MVRGKTTLVKLLLNFYGIEKGQILIDGNNILDIKKETLRERIAYVPQETFLFSGTILENLSLGLENENMEEIVEAAKMAKAHDFINEHHLDIIHILKKMVQIFQVDKDKDLRLQEQFLRNLIY